MMILGPCEQVHAQIEGPHRWGAIWVPVEQMVKHSRILTGVPFEHSTHRAALAPFTGQWQKSA